MENPSWKSMFAIVSASLASDRYALIKLSYKRQHITSRPCFELWRGDEPPQCNKAWHFMLAGVTRLLNQGRFWAPATEIDCEILTRHQRVHLTIPRELFERCSKTTCFVCTESEHLDLAALPDPARAKVAELINECLFAQNEQGLDDWAAVLGRRQMQRVAAGAGCLVAAIERRDLDLACKLWAWGAPVPPAEALWQAVVGSSICNVGSSTCDDGTVIWDTSLLVAKIVSCSLVETNALLELCNTRVASNSALVLIVAVCMVFGLDYRRQLAVVGAPSSAGDAVGLLLMLGGAQASRAVRQLSISDTRYGQNLLKFVALLSGLDAVLH